MGIVKLAEATTINGVVTDKDFGLHDMATKNAAECDQATIDARHYGNGFLRINPDGTIDRINPRDVMICGQEK